MFYTKGGFQGDSEFLTKKNIVLNPPCSPFNGRKFIFMANNTIKGGHTPNKTTALTGKNFNRELDSW
jgi:hypothetical protein